MRNEVLNANFSTFNMMSTIAYGVIIFALVLSVIKHVKHDKKPLDWTLLAHFLAIGAFSLLLISHWVNLPLTHCGSCR